MSRRAKAAIAGSASAIALAVTYLIQPWEGRELVAYRDLVGKWTICDGDTENVRPGQIATKAECDKRTWERVVKFYAPKVAACIATWPDAPMSWQATAISLAYNIGPQTVCNSTAARRAHARDWRGSCEAFTWYNRAGGQVVRGLKLRREFGDDERIGELELCLEGLR